MMSRARSVYYKIIGSFILSGILLYIGFNYSLSSAERNLFISIPFTTYFQSVIIIIPFFIFNGIQLQLLYKKMIGIRLSTYDIITLPFVANLWGFIMPFHGSFLYTIVYIFSKYKKGISQSVKVYIVIFSFSLFFAGLFGPLYYLFSDLYLPKIFFLLCCLLFINPLIIYLVGKLNFGNTFAKFKFTKRMVEGLVNLANFDKIEKELIFYLAGLKIINVTLISLWSYWLIITLHLNLSFMQVVLITLLMEITVLIKLTPGNIGLNQFASGGIAMLVGGTLADGFILSSFQYISNLIVATTIGGTFSFLNMKYFNWNVFRAMLTGEKTL